MKPWHLMLLWLIGVGASLAAGEAIPGATAIDWLTNPEDAGRRAGETADHLTDLLTKGGIGAVALAVLWGAKRWAPLVSRIVPFWGPLIELVANGAWAVAATPDQKAADRAKDIATDAAATVAPVLLALRQIPPQELPEHLRDLLARPIVRAAIDHLAGRDGGA